MKNKEGGFIQLIIIVIVAFLLMRYFDITVTEIFNWFKALFRSII